MESPTKSRKRSARTPELVEPKSRIKLKFRALVHAQIGVNMIYRKHRKDERPETSKSRTTSLGRNPMDQLTVDPPVSRKGKVPRRSRLTST